MTKKFHILLIVLTLGFFMTPTLTYACGNKSVKTEKSSCKKEKTDKSEKKDCCKNHQSKNGKSDDSCNGKCKDTSCSCPTTNGSLALSLFAELNLKNSFAESKKLKFYIKEIFLSSGFYSIWTPPHIG